MISKRFKRMTRSLPALLLACAFAAPAHAQFWEKKDWREWSKQECEKMLTDSPWARRFTTTVIGTMASGLSAGGVEGREANPNIEYIAQVRSALPIRQAVIRSMQIQTKYDKMSDVEKKSFDQQAEQYLTQSFDNRLVMHVAYSTNIQSLDRDLARLWQSVIPPAIPVNTYLITPKGDRMEVARFIPPEGSGMREFELIFHKEWKGSPLVMPEDRNLQLELPGVAFNERRILIEFDVRKMKYRGQLEY